MIEEEAAQVFKEERGTPGVSPLQEAADWTPISP
jgi:hypothetical protein